MRKIWLAVAVVAMMTMTACQKETDDDGPVIPPAGTRLMKTVYKSGADSTVTNYTYNGGGSLSAFAVSGSSGGQPVDLRVTLVRNTSGIITKQVLKSNEFIALGIDSIATVVTYDAGNSRYRHAITSLSFFGFNFTDSLVFNYDAGGKLVSQIDYLDDGGGMGYQPVSKTEYTYSGNNVQSMKIYSYDVGGYTLEETYTYEYDNKINPMKFSSDAPILGMAQYYSANNATKSTLVSVADPTDNFVADVTYTYNTADRPLTGTEVISGTMSTMLFTYQ